MSRKIDKKSGSEPGKELNIRYYRIKFREDGRQFTASSGALLLIAGTVVMIKTDHGLEPAKVAGIAPLVGCQTKKHKTTYEISRQANNEERDKYENLSSYEDRASSICGSLIEKHELSMRLVRVERFFNGSKMIFYFTADNRVDFRSLVKDLVQEFRTRVEMRQVGVRHETKMIGGIGTCGRELCCSSFIKKFDSVSIKMAKEQDLPLNPSKISGVCNRLLCCLTYEYDTYKRQRKDMPKPGKSIKIGENEFRVRRQNPLQESILVQDEEGNEVTLEKEQWKSFQNIKKETSGKRKEKKKKEES